MEANPASLAPRILVEEVADGGHVANALFRRRYKTDAPDFPHHVVASWSDGTNRIPLCYIHFTAVGEILLGGGACVDDRALRRAPADLRRAIRAAGGATINADIQAINLAAIAQDGTEIVVPAKGVTPGVVPATTSHKVVPTGVRIPINQASVTTLESLPGIGIKKAQAIFDYRHVHGLFTSINQLSQVKGIGPKLLEKILPYLSLH